MSSPQMVKADAAPTAATVDLKLEVVVIPVSDVDRSRRFYEGLGWRLDIDFATGPAFRAVQMTPPGSAMLDPLRHGHHGGRAGLDPEPVPRSSPTWRRPAPSSSSVAPT